MISSYTTPCFLLAMTADAPTTEDAPVVDIYRDTPLRYLGYTNEVGEAFRNLVHRAAVRATYLVSASYVLADASSKARQEYALPEGGKPVRTFTDVLIWQGLASVAIPGFTINRVCWAVGKAVGSLSPKTRSVVVTGSGLLAIPFIIKPIDHGVDLLMEKGLRPYVLKHVNV